MHMRVHFRLVPPALYKNKNVYSFTTRLNLCLHLMYKVKQKHLSKKIRMMVLVSYFFNLVLRIIPPLYYKVK
jgi:hypothetical protein